LGPDLGCLAEFPEGVLPIPGKDQGLGFRVWGLELRVWSFFRRLEGYLAHKKTPPRLGPP